MRTKSRLAASLVIIAGTALVGAMIGCDLGPVRLELSQSELTELGAAFGAVLALIACGFAMESSEARARLRDEILRLKWLLFRTKEKSSSAVSLSNLQDRDNPAPRQTTVATLG